VPRGFAEGAVMMRAQAAAAAAPAEEAVGETHVYTLPGTVDVAPGETNTVALFPRAEAQVEPEYLLRQSWYVFQSRQPQVEADLHAEVSYLVRRAAKTTFGDTPLPAGTFRVLTPDSAGRLQLLGEAQQFRHGADLELLQLHGLLGGGRGGSRGLFHGSPSSVGAAASGGMRIGRRPMASSPAGGGGPWARTVRRPAGLG